MGSGREALSALEQLKPLFHPDPASVAGALENQFTTGPREVEGAGGASYAIGRGVLEYLAGLSPSEGTSLETGCGYSTVVLTSVFRTHISVNPDLASNRLVRDFVARHIGNTDLRHVETSSDQGLPGLVAERCQVELALIDGNHSHPFPLLDFHYVDQLLAPDGLLLVDNTEIHAVQELTEYLEMEPAYRLDRLIGNCAVYRKVKDREFGWKSQTIRRPSEGVDAVRHELTRLRIEVAPDLRASLNGAAPLPAIPTVVPSAGPEGPRVAAPAPTTKRSHPAPTIRTTRNWVSRLVRWYTAPSGILAGAALVLLAVGIAGSGFWSLIGVAGIVLLGLFLPYRFVREQRRTDRRVELLRAELMRQFNTGVAATTRATRDLGEQVETRFEGVDVGIGAAVTAIEEMRLQLEYAAGDLREDLTTLRREVVVLRETTVTDAQRIAEVEARMKPSRRFGTVRLDDPKRPELAMRDATKALRRPSRRDPPA